MLIQTHMVSEKQNVSMTTSDLKRNLNCVTAAFLKWLQDSRHGGKAEG